MKKFLISNRRKLLRNYHYELLDDKSYFIDKNPLFTQEKQIKYKNFPIAKSFLALVKNCYKFF